MDCDSFDKSIFNLQATTDITGSKESAMHSFRLFMDDLPQTMPKFGPLIISQNISELKALCHYIKSSTAYCVVPDVQEKLTEFHGLLSETPEESDKWQPAFCNFKDAVEKLLAAVHSANQ